MFCFAALLIVKAILYIWKKYRQNTGNLNLLGFSSYFNKIFCCIGPPGSQVFNYISINITNSESTKVISHLSTLCKVLIAQILVVAYP